VGAGDEPVPAESLRKVDGPHRAEMNAHAAPLTLYGIYGIGNLMDPVGFLFDRIEPT